MGLFRRRADPLDPIRIRLTGLDEQLREARAANEAMADRMRALERHAEDELASQRQRLQEIGSIVTSQLGELAGGLDALEASFSVRIADLEARSGKVDPDAIASTAAVEELRVRQVALANELARFELSLRGDLARAVERLGPRSRS
jgi:hypothetical protein